MRAYLILLGFLVACSGDKGAVEDTNAPEAPDEEHEEGGNDDTSDTTDDTADSGDDTGQDTGGGDTDGTSCSSADADEVHSVILDAYAVLFEADNTSDNDGDGFTGSGDCDDSDASIGGFLSTNATGGESHDLTTIEAAINFASDGGTVTICGWQSIKDGINLNVDGTQSDWLLTITGQESSTGIPAVVTGSTSSGLEIYSTSVTIEDLFIFGNTANDSDKEDNAHPRGAGIRAGEGSTVYGTNVHILSNSIGSSDHGIAVYANDANVILTGSVIAYNSHEDDAGGGGKGAIYVDDATVFELHNSIVVANGNSERGQGLFLRDHDYTATVTDTCLGDNLPHDVKLNETSEFHDFGAYVSFTVSGSTHQLEFPDAE